MIDNYDSFTYNVVQYLGELGADVKVYRNDAISIAEIEAMAPAQIVISPGPYLFPDYPAHLHIDILARAQGKKLGRRLMDTLIQALRDQGAAAVHLGMSVHNDHAYGFYIHYGFKELSRDEDTIHMGLSL